MANTRSNGNGKWTEAFLAAYRECGVVKFAAERAGISRQHVYWRIDNDPAFAEQMADADKDARDTIVREVHRRGVEGWDEPVYQGGVQVGVVRKYSDTLLIFLTKQRDPSFRDSFRHEHTGAGGGPMVALVIPSDEERALEVAQLLAAQGALEAAP